MSILNKITKNNLFLNKKRNIVTVIGIILSVALITAVSTMILSARSSLIEFEKKERGNYHFLIKDISIDDFKYVKNNNNFENIYYSNEIGYAKINESKNVYKPYAYIMSYDTNGLNSIKNNIVEGSLPVNDNEILIPTSLKDNGRVHYKIGDTITLNLGKRMTEGYELNQDNPITSEEEFILSNITKTYKIVGIMERPNNVVEPYLAPGYTFITLDNNPQDNIDVYARFNKKGLRNMSGSLNEILGVKKETLDLLYFVGGKANNNEELKEDYQNMKYPLTVNNYLISCEKIDINSTALRPLYIAGIVVIIIIIVTSVYCIKNAFNISITEKTKQFGMLSSIGATKRQIKKIVLNEAKYLGLVGVPLGMLLGLLASYILIIMTNTLLYEYLKVHINLVVSVTALLASVLLSIITLYLSSIISAIKASKMAPLVAIRGNEDIKVKNKKYKAPFFIKKIFKIGGVVSYKNLKRNKKKYRTAIVSIIVCVIAFIPLSTFIDTLFEAARLAAGEENYIISISSNDNDKMLDKYLDRIISLDKVKDYSITKRINFLIDDNKYFSSEYLTTTSRNYCIEEECYYAAEIVSLGEKAYKKYINELNLNYNTMKDKAIVLNKVNKLIYMEDKAVKKKVDKLNKNFKKINGIISNGDSLNMDLEIGYYASEYPVSYMSNDTNAAVFVVSDEFFNKYAGDRNYKIYIDTDHASDLQEEIEKILGNEDYSFSNIEEDTKAVRALFLVLSIFLYGFITVVALIGITNIFNTITTSMNLRRREFASLQSIGMTSKEFFRMIALENIFYIFKSLIISIPVGTLLSYLLYKVINNGDMVIEYIFPIKAIIIVSLAVTLILFVIMRYSIKKINEQNIIETIRNDNI